MKDFKSRAEEIIEGEKAKEYKYIAYAQADNIYASFTSHIDWEFRKWAKQ